MENLKAVQQCEFGDSVSDFDNKMEKSRLIIKELFNKRRMLNGEIDKPSDFEEEARPHIQNVLHHVDKNKTINLILPAFPTKSPNRNKTLSHLPDYAEEHALKNLELLCERIKRIHPPGAKVTICSDGRVFADLIRVPDDQVSDYGKALREYAEKHHKETIDFFDLDDIYPDVKSYDALREELMITHGESLAHLRQRCKEKKEASSMYKGIARFILEDYSGIDPFKHESRASVQKVARINAYRVIQRSNAWTRLLKQHFPHAVRLSIHPQYRVSEKIGVFLVESDDCWSSPWHAVALKQGKKITLLPRHMAETRPGTVLAYSNGRPSHFECLNHVPGKNNDE